MIDDLKFEHGEKKEHPSFCFKICQLIASLCKRRLKDCLLLFLKIVDIFHFTSQNYLTHTDGSILYRSIYATHTDRSILHIQMDLSYIGLSILHIQIDLSYTYR